MYFHLHILVRNSSAGRCYATQILPEQSLLILLPLQKFREKVYSGHYCSCCGRKCSSNHTLAILATKKKHKKVEFPTGGDECGELILVLLFLKYILLIMLLRLSHFFSPLFPSTLYPHFHQHSTPPQLSSYPWIVHVSSLASPFP